ncbi:hypothetical protein SKAU_G00332070 [Synaphobranchus kaupii]|uniref:Ig-like domain-containing protein n=1 Tax=Synaphobranchus kaupii TaxID=118154 RepID=A0A9Q1EL91_SYNKA|nr:hypothetical protein SKAU_G00332070 [Synaphobranchus kaupii]
MFKAANRFVILFYLFPGLTNSVKFEQIPSCTARPGQQVEIKCSHDDSGLNVMYWYEQQVESKALRLIGFGYSTGDPTYEAPFTSRFQLRRESVQKGSLVISNVTGADSAAYFCAAKMSSGPVVLQPGPPLTPSPGDTVTLQCSMAAGISMSSYTMLWYRQARSEAPLEFLKKEYDTSEETDRFSVSLSTSENSVSLRAANLTAADSATYYCAASLTNSVKFEQIPSCTARPGQQVEIKCSHDDSGLNVMYWYEQQVESKALRLIGFGYSTGDPTYEAPFTSRFQLRRESVQKGSLVISNVTGADSAAYFCAAKMSSGPVVLQPGPPLTPSPGDTVTLQCSMAAGISMSSYTMLWYRQARSEAPLEFLKKEYDTSEETDRFSVSLSTSENSVSLRAANLTAADSATYYCAASLTNSVKFEQIPACTARPGQQVEIKCSHDDSDLLVMYWYEQQVESKALHLVGFGYSTGDPTYEAPFTSRFQLRRESVQKGSLVISNVTGADSAAYFCAAKVSRPVVLQPGPPLTPSPGDTVTLQCSIAAGLSMSSYTMLWYRQVRSGASLEFLKKEYETSEETDRFSVSISTSENSFSLRAANLTAADSATYYCAASHGAAEPRGRRTISNHCCM